MLAPFVLAILVASVGPTEQALAVSQPPAAPAQNTPDKPWPPAGVFRESDGVTLPRLVKGTKPRYRLAAMKAKVQGGVTLEAVVQTDGTVGEVRVVRSLDKEFGMDDEAVETVKQWRFEPGKKDSEPVPVLVVVEMSFSMKK
jgi:TonB family protein